jgi:tetratricopeptide (TPR) repeat protein
MAKRAQRSLTASEAGIKQAKKALTDKAWVYDNLAQELDITRQPVVRFFTGKTVDRKIFVNICKKLELDWQNIVPPPISQPESKLEQKEQSNTQPANAEPEQVEEVLDNFCNIEVVVERVRSHSPLCAEDFNKLGINKAKERDFKGAIENFDRAIKLNPDYADAYSNRASVRHELGDDPGAIEDYKEAILLNPDCAVYHNNLGIISYNSDDYRGARVAHTRAIQLNPGYAQAYNDRGFARLRLGDLQGALKDFSQAIELNADDALAWNNRGDVYFLELGYLQEALDDYTQAARLNPKNPKTFYYLGVIHSRLGNKEKALEDFIKAIELKRDFAEAYYNRGIVHYELGYSQRADEDFHNAKILYRQQGKEENYQKVLNLIEELQQEDGERSHLVNG